ncbi:C1 [Tomato yellow leaf curl China virus satellite DNA beta-Dali198]|uniref:C1 protein n=2 Tax=Tomato leaf curl China betasatellite TaxID=278069 RepID=D2X8T2_9VIRU|nr:C1 [Tomato yellow leaf curl China virus satellite DNA beta-Dali198]ADB43295.1 C1 protein [Tomato leaf curl China betasatellite]ADB43296.1 C1 protein [Tomato leaf curl China betasatellite]ADB43302.1 C1 protein [Tomato leaf curl China betasatellite]ADB43303.1 C1 protein [Tomato leaf curl China betasatellite]
MTIKYNNNKGLEFIIDVKLQEDTSILVQIELASTRSPALAKKKFMIPYRHNGIMPPLDFNSLEEGIRHCLKIMYKESTIWEFRQEDMVQVVDILMMEEAPVEDIDVGDEYDVFLNSSV